MGMEPKAFIELAKGLCEQSDNEAALRSAVSRSYYGLFNFLKRFYENHFRSLPKDATSHDAVYVSFHNCGVQEVVLIASDLETLRQERNDADYDLQTNTFQNPNHITMLFLKARIAYDKFEKISSNSQNRKRIVKGIKAYKGKTNT